MPSWPLPPDSLLHVAAEMINAGTKVAILVGQGCLNARDEVLALAEKVGGPIIKALLGKAVVPDESPYTTGGIGLLGTAPSQDAMHHFMSRLTAQLGASALLCVASLPAQAEDTLAKIRDCLRDMRPEIKWAPEFDAAQAVIRRSFF